MLIKYCSFEPSGFHVITSGDYNDHLVKTAEASPVSVDSLRSFAYEKLPKDKDRVYALVSAMGASEYYGNNSNGDIFTEKALNHTPPGWDDMSYEEQVRAGKSWEWGYPTFYNAKPFQHHKNKDPNRAFGDVVYVLWDDLMKRVLLIIAFSRSKAEMEGALNVIERIDNGEHPSVSMGARLLFDNCSICCDWERIAELGTNDPKAILIEHKRRPIQGVATTPSAYCDHLKFEKNKIYPDGRIVGMVNTHPKFFDISVVFVGADKTSYILTKLSRSKEPWEVICE